MASVLTNLVQDVNIGYQDISNIDDGTINGAILKHQNQLGGSTASNIYFRKDSNGKWGYSETPDGAITNFKNPTGNAVSSQVLNGVTFATSASDSETGNMPNRGAISTTVPIGNTYTIPAGYHNGNGAVAGRGNLTGSIAAAAQVLNGYNFYTNTGSASGSMTNRGAISTSINLNGSYTIPAGYHNGSGKITQNLTATTRSVTLESSAVSAAAQSFSLTTAANRFNNGVTVNVKNFYNAATAAGAANIINDPFVIYKAGSDSTDVGTGSSNFCKKLSDTRILAAGKYKLTITAGAHTGDFGQTTLSWDGTTRHYSDSNHPTGRGNTYGVDNINSGAFFTWVDTFSLSKATEVTLKTNNRTDSRLQTYTALITTATGSPI